MSIAEILGSILIVIGVLIAAIAMVGLVRFNDVLSRMHAASKPQTLGLVLVLAGAAIASKSLALDDRLERDARACRVPPRLPPGERLRVRRAHAATLHRW